MMLSSVTLRIDAFWKLNPTPSLTERSANVGANQSKQNRIRTLHVVMEMAMYVQVFCERRLRMEDAGVLGLCWEEEEDAVAGMMAP